jgi:ABC-type branched-subunit amino acid transport system ATPase component
VAVGVAKLRTSRIGLQMLAVRANERSAAGAGVDVIRVKIVAFAIASFIAGLGGALIGYLQATGLTGQPFDALQGLAIFTCAYLAGITSVSGGLFTGLIAAGGLLAYVSSTWIHLGGQWYAVLSGIALVLTVILNPEGTTGQIHAFLERRRHGATPPVPRAIPEDVTLTPEPPRVGGDVVLAANSVSVSYGGFAAVRDVALTVQSGTIVGLIGPNGAGKTTLLDALSGFTRSTGIVTLNRQEISQLSAHQRVRAGLGRTFQRTELYEDLSVVENILVGAAAARGRDARTVQDVLALLDLSEYAERPVSELSQGRRQLVSIARALIGNPEVLLLDEPAGGLDSHESQWLGMRLRAIRDSGVTILIIDHDMHLVLNLCDRIYVLNFGEVIAGGTPTEIRADARVAAAYLGAAHSGTPPADAQAMDTGQGVML